MSAGTALHALRGTLVDFTADPHLAGAAAMRHVEDGLLVIRDGLIEAAGPARDLLQALPVGTPVADQRGKILMPGFVDAHIHYPQTDIIASHGKQLMDWLHTYTFPAEGRFADIGHARSVAAFFLDELLSNGTTTAAVYPTVHKHSAEALFEAMTIARIAYANQPRLSTPLGALRRPTTNDNAQIAASNISADTPIPYRISDIQKVIDEWLGLLERRYPISTLRALRARLDSLSHDPRYRAMFGKTMVADNMVEVISNLFRIPKNGRPVTILELGGLPNEVVNALVSVIGRLAFDISFLSGKDQEIMLVCEEAHRYVPRDPSMGFRPTRLALGRIAKEGRKYGVSLGVISQRPAEIDPTLLSQCSTIFAMRLPNEADKNIIRECLPAYSASLSDTLSSMVDRGALAFGEAIPTPMRMTFAHHPTGKLPPDPTPEPEEDSPQRSIARIVSRLRGEPLMH